MRRRLAPKQSDATPPRSRPPLSRSPAALAAMSRFASPFSTPSDSMSSFQRTDAPSSGLRRFMLPGGGGGNGNSAGPPPPRDAASSFTGSNAGSTALNAESARTMARSHYDELAKWLFPGEPPHIDPQVHQARLTPRQKLSRLTRQQFAELSTDVYDELCRRIERGEQDGAPGKGGIPFLLSRAEFHPKRNQARQKLATLAIVRFKDLAGDVFHELGSRYPEFLESEVPQQSSTPQQDDATPSVAPPSNINVGLSGSLRSNLSRGQGSLSDRRAAPNAAAVRTPGGVANDVVVPDKSTLVVEDDMDETSPAARSGFGRQDSTARSNAPSRPISPASVGRSEYYDKMSLGGGGRGSDGSAIGGRMLNTMASNGNMDSSAKQREKDEAVDKIRSDYEYKLAQLNQRLTAAEREVEQARQSAGNSASSTANKVRDLERDLRTAETNARTERDRNSKLVQDLRALESDMKNEQSQRASENQMAQNDTEQLRRQLQGLEAALQQARQGSRKGMTNSAQVEGLKSQMTDLLDELRSMQGRLDELLLEKENDAERMLQLEHEVTTWKKRYEGQKTKLRKFQRTSTMFVAPNNQGNPEDRMPVSEHGLVADIHFTGFTTAIDELLLAARSNEGASVITSMRHVVTATACIEEDITAHEVDSSNSSWRHVTPQGDKERVAALKTRTNATLSNLITASKNHATSYGLSPVSLVDAAASHVTNTMIELIKLVGLRKATDYEVDEAERVGISGRDDDDDSLPPPPQQLTQDARAPSPVTNGHDHVGNGGSILNGVNRNGRQRPAAIDRRQNDDSFSLDTPTTTATSATPSPSVMLRKQLPPLKGLGMNGGGAGTNMRGGSYDDADDDEDDRYPSSMRGSPSVAPLVPSKPSRTYSDRDRQGRDFRNGTTNGNNTKSRGGDYDDMRSPNAGGASSSASGSRGGDMGGRDSMSGRSSAEKVFDSPPPPSRKGGMGDLNRLPPQEVDMNRGVKFVGSGVAAPTSGGGRPRMSDVERQQLKKYLEAQTEAIVAYIQSLLSSIRNGTTINGSPSVSDTLTQIITIVSSIVAMTNDRIEANGSLSSVGLSREEEEEHTSLLGEVLRELTSQCNRLSEMQNNVKSTGGTNGFGKQTKQAMASASFGVAKALKELNSLIAGEDTSTSML